MTNEDITFIEQCRRNIAVALYSYVDTFGPHYLYNSAISFDEIKRATGRQRLALNIIQEYIDYFRHAGIHAELNGCVLSFSTCAADISLNPSEHARLAQSIDAFRLRANLNGDMENM